jgi:hypothetical protein
MDRVSRSTARDSPIFENPQAWYGPAMAARSDWIIALDKNDIAELDAAVATVQANKLPLVDLKPKDFPLPKLARKLKEIRQELLHGRGFVLMRGWPTRQRSIEQSAAAFMGVGLHFGEDMVTQNGSGHVLGHVANLGEDYSDPSTRGHRTSAELKFHVDGGDIVGLLCLERSRSGGLSRIASSTTVWNEMIRRRPDCARLLTHEYAWTRWGEIGEGQAPFYQMPVFLPYANKMICHFSVSTIEKAQRFPDAPRLGAAQKEALDMVNELAGDPQIQLEMDFQPGDMQFLCNHFIIHSRTAYEDWPEKNRRRHLLRLWVSSSDGPPVPHYFTEAQGATSTGRPAGINVPGVQRIAPLTPTG